jgi:hypothetical protein
MTYNYIRLQRKLSLTFRLKCLILFKKKKKNKQKSYEAMLLSKIRFFYLLPRVEIRVLKLVKFNIDLTALNAIVYSFQNSKPLKNTNSK